MGIKSFLSLPFARFIVSKNKHWKNNAVEAQKKTMLSLVKRAKNTSFGKEHSFSKIKNYGDFKRYIPIRDYEKIKPYIESIISGKENVL